MAKFYVVHQHHQSHHDKKGHAVHERVDKVLRNKPESWIQYEHTRDGWFDIISMEFNELQNIRFNGTHEQLVVAITHLAAAATEALDKMTCD